MLKGLLKKLKRRGKLISALAISAALLAPVGAKAQESPGLPCEMGCAAYAFDGELSGNLDITLQVMGVADLEAYLSLVISTISITNEEMKVEGLVRALSKNDQFLKFNKVCNYEVKNEASASESALKNAQGNIGVNIAAGDFNAQSNIVAIAAGEEESSLVESKTFSVQKAMFNKVQNEGMTNSASAEGEVLKNAQGNIGLNIAAGSNNAQTNQLGVAVAPAKVGIATAYVQQKSMYNMVTNNPIQEEEVKYYDVNLTLYATGRASRTGVGGLYGGYTWGNFEEEGIISGTSKGMSYQANNFYPDTWELNEEYEPHNQHPHSPQQIGHLDMDYETQGAILNPFRSTEDQPVGGLAFDNDNTIEGTYEGEGDYEGGESGVFLGWVGAQRINLSGNIIGSIPVVTVKNIDTVNTASLSGSVLANAVGNIGVNIAAGSNNLQANALSVIYIAESGGVEISTSQPGIGE